MHKIDWSLLVFVPYQNDYDMLLTLYNHLNWSLDRIAKKLGVNKFTVRRRLVELGIPIKGRGGKRITITT